MNENNQVAHTTEVKSSPYHIVIYTDGACSGNPGPGGWAYSIRRHEGTSVKKKVTGNGGTRHTTNNRMEMRAVIEALKRIKLDEAAPITIRSDSQTVIKGMNEWLPKWIANGWKASGKKDVKNRDLWLEIIRLSEAQNITWEWVKGHAGEPFNEEVDTLAQAAMRAVV